MVYKPIRTKVEVKINNYGEKHKVITSFASKEAEHQPPGEHGDNLAKCLKWDSLSRNNKDAHLYRYINVHKLHSVRGLYLCLLV